MLIEYIAEGNGPRTTVDMEHKIIARLWRRVPSPDVMVGAFGVDEFGPYYDAEASSTGWTLVTAGGTPALEGNV